MAHAQDYLFTTIKLLIAVKFFLLISYTKSMFGVALLFQNHVKNSRQSRSLVFHLPIFTAALVKKTHVSKSHRYTKQVS